MSTAVVGAVSAMYPRVDVTCRGTIYLGVAVHGAGGIMGAAGPWFDIPSRIRACIRTGGTLRIYVGEDVCVDLPAADVTLLAVYAPGYAR